MAKKSEKVYDVAAIAIRHNILEKYMGEKLTSRDASHIVEAIRERVNEFLKDNLQRVIDDAVEDYIEEYNHSSDDTDDGKIH